MASDTGGVKPFPIGGRMVRMRERLAGMTDAERSWRKQFLQDQHLSENEPCLPENFYKERYNPIRRFYRAPLEALQRMLTPTFGPQRAFSIRFWTGKIGLIALGIYSTTYYFKYNTNDWTRKGSWRVITSRSAVNLGESEYPKVSDRKEPADYASRGFENSPI